MHLVEDAAAGVSPGIGVEPGLAVQVVIHQDFATQGTLPELLDKRTRWVALARSETVHTNVVDDEVARVDKDVMVVNVNEIHVFIDALPDATLS